MDFQLTERQTAWRDRVRAFMQAHRIAPRDGADAWEIVHSTEPPAANAANPNDPVEHTEIFYPIG